MGAGQEGRESSWFSREKKPEQSEKIRQKCGDGGGGASRVPPGDYFRERGLEITDGICAVFAARRYNLVGIIRVSPA